MSISVTTDFGNVRVEPFVVPEDDERHGGGSVFGSSLTFDGVEYTASVEFNAKGEPVPYWRVLLDDPQAYDITYARDLESPFNRYYAMPAVREPILRVLSQAFAEASYTDRFQQINSYYTMKRLADLLRERTQVNRQLRATLKELVEMDIVLPRLNEASLPSYFSTSEQHRMEFEGAIGIMAKHVLMFPLTEDQRGQVRLYGGGCDQGSWLAIDEVHRQVCPLLIVKEEYTD